MGSLQIPLVYDRRSTDNIKAHKMAKFREPNCPIEETERYHGARILGEGSNDGNGLLIREGFNIDVKVKLGSREFEVILLVVRLEHL